MISVYPNNDKKETIVGHIPFSMSKEMFKLLRLSQSKLGCTVKGRRVNRGGGLVFEILVKYTLYGHKKALFWIQEKIKKKPII